MNKDEDYVPRSITLSDVMVVIAGFVHNLTAAFHMLTDELLELATYNSIRDNQVKKAWKNFTEDLEKMEDNNG